LLTVGHRGFVAFDAVEDLLGMLGGVVDRDPDLPGV
jgi:hypothetical protein